MSQIRISLIRWMNREMGVQFFIGMVLAFIWAIKHICTVRTTFRTIFTIYYVCSTSSFSIKKLHRVADLWPRHVKWGRPVKNAVHISNLYRPRFWQVDSPEVLLIDGPLLFSIWMASGPHVAMIFYPPFSTTHFFLLITWLILMHITE